MSKMGRVVFDIMQKFDGQVPVGYTLNDYFRDEEETKRTEKQEISTDRKGSVDLYDKSQEEHGSSPNP